MLALSAILPIMMIFECGVGAEVGMGDGVARLIGIYVLSCGWSSYQQEKNSKYSQYFW
jgi:hypothetical protein